MSDDGREELPTTIDDIPLWWDEWKRPAQRVHCEDCEGLNTLYWSSGHADTEDSPVLFRARGCNRCGAVDLFAVVWNPARGARLKLFAHFPPVVAA